MFVQCGKASEMQNFFSKITSFYEASKRRISDVSSLSSHSRISSATGDLTKYYFCPEMF